MYLLGLAACIGHIAAACGNDQPGNESATGHIPSGDRIVFFSVVVTHSGVVRDVRVLSGPTTLQSAALNAIKQWKYNRKEIDSFGAAAVGKSTRRLELAVIFPAKKGAPLKIHQAMPAGVSSCIAVDTVRISPEAAESLLLNRVYPVYPPDVLGLVALRVRIDKRGNVVRVEKINGSDLVFPAASEAVKAWKYRPYLLNGTPVEVETIVISGQL